MWTWQGEGGLLNVHITIKGLFGKMVHKEMGGVKKVKKSVHMVYECPLGVRLMIIRASQITEFLIRIDYKTICILSKIYL